MILSKLQDPTFKNYSNFIHDVNKVKGKDEGLQLFGHKMEVNPSKLSAL